MDILDRECGGVKTDLGVATLSYRKTEKIEVRDQKVVQVKRLKRVGRYIRKKDKVNFSESRKIADRRIEPLKKYKIIKK